MTTWAEYLDALEEWVRRADDPAALPPLAAPTTVPATQDGFRMRIVLAQMAQRQQDLQLERRTLLQAASYARA